jgi:hypothetical protein
MDVHGVLVAGSPAIPCDHLCNVPSTTVRGGEQTGHKNEDSLTVQVQCMRLVKKPKAGNG